MHGAVGSDVGNQDPVKEAVINDVISFFEVRDSLLPRVSSYVSSLIDIARAVQPGGELHVQGHNADSVVFACADENAVVVLARGKWRRLAVRSIFERHKIGELPIPDSSRPTTASHGPPAGARRPSSVAKGTAADPAGAAMAGSRAGSRAGSASTGKYAERLMSANDAAAVAATVAAAEKKAREKLALTRPLPLRSLNEVISGKDLLTRSLPADPLTPSATAPSAGTNFNSTNASDDKPPMAPEKPLETLNLELRVSRQVHGSFTFLSPEPLPGARLLGLSRTCAEMLQLDPSDPFLVPILSGNTVPRFSNPWAANYAGHQFGFYAGQLGDGRVVSLGELEVGREAAKERWELQLKGCGRTPYSRFGDGLAVIASSVREFLASEYMAALGVPTARALSVVAGPRAVYREGVMKSAAVTARVAKSWMRFGSFELYWYRGEKDKIRVLADYLIKAHFAWIDEKWDEKTAAAAAAAKEAKPVAPVGDTAIQEKKIDAPSAKTEEVTPAKKEDATPTKDLPPAKKDDPPLKRKKSISVARRASIAPKTA
ncbi:hypothetical protein HK101_005731, partial [Irineochytrium annulatum]